jgi:hypothetical protein
MTKKEAYLDWARRVDLAWIGENRDVFRPAAVDGFATLGRGALVVDLARPLIDGGHPFSYYPQVQIEMQVGATTGQLVHEYDPDQELVVVLFKPDHVICAYRLSLNNPETSST